MYSTDVSTGAVANPRYAVFTVHDKAFGSFEAIFSFYSLLLDGKFFDLYLNIF